MNDYSTSTSNGTQPLCTVRFIDETDLIAGAKYEDLIKRIETVSRSHGMAISMEKKARYW